MITGLFSKTNTYEIQLYAVDTIGEMATITFNIPTDDIPLHLGYGGKAVGIGRYADTAKPHSLSIAWKVFLDDVISMGDVDLSFGSDLTDLANKPTSYDTGLYVRAITTSTTYYLLLCPDNKLYSGVQVGANITWRERG